MNCPACDVEMAELSEDDQKVHACGDCGGLWIDMADLNHHLLHNGLPGLGAMSGRTDPSADAATCRECMIDLTHIEAGPRNDSIYYESCEGCGGVFIEPGEAAPADLKTAHAQLVAFFREFEAKRSATAK